MVIFFQTRGTWVVPAYSMHAELHRAALERSQPWNTRKLVLDVKENGVLQRTKGRDVVTETEVKRSLWLQLPINMSKIMPLKCGPNSCFCSFNVLSSFLASAHLVVFISV